RKLQSKSSERDPSLPHKQTRFCTIWQAARMCERSAPEMSNRTVHTLGAEKIREYRLAGMNRQGLCTRSELSYGHKSGIGIHKIQVKTFSTPITLTSNVTMLRRHRVPVPSCRHRLIGPCLPQHPRLQRQFHLLWRSVLESVFAEERADKFVDQPRIIAGSHDHRCFKLQ